MAGKDYNVVLTEKDRSILESLSNTLDGLAEYLGDGYEFVLHSLEDAERSVIKIINGYHTGRKVGAPITDLALQMLDKVNSSEGSDSITYFTRNKNGEPLKSTTIAVRGENGRIIGLLCINFYLNSSFSDIISGFFDMHGTGFRKETFVDNPNDGIKEAYERVHSIIEANDSISISQKNKEMIMLLKQYGVFKIKNAVSIVADLMGISKNTVYMHLRNIGD
ncbi:MAG: PAS domain-containing protein [Spirochaetales bacterium]|nr:PAS domain-containing protein [Spirochaetales bacterium]MBQ4281997.1 PAS domain-containing protein [Spirochaetales bacterium]